MKSAGRRRNRGVGPNMMLEPGWPDVAKRIHAWLGNLELVSPAR
jgi:hypothetical protein